MSEEDSSVGSAVLHGAAELARMHDAQALSIDLHPLGQDLLEEFAYAIEEDYGPVRFGFGIVRFPRSGDDDGDRLLEGSWVDLESDTRVEES